MKKSQIKSIIKEYIYQHIKESSIQSSYDRLDQALTGVEEFIIKNSIQIDPIEHPSDGADPYGIRQPFLYGGINYEQTKDAHYKLVSFKGRPTRKYLHISIYRLSSGRYELTYYVL